MKHGRRSASKKIFKKLLNFGIITHASLGEVSELADEHDLGSCAERHGGSSPPFPTKVSTGRTRGRLAMSLPYRRKSVSRHLHRNFEAGFSGFRVKHGMVIVFLNTLKLQYCLGGLRFRGFDVV